MRYSIEVGKEHGWPVRADEVSQVGGVIHDKNAISTMAEPECQVSGAECDTLIEVSVMELPAPKDDSGAVVMPTAYFEALQHDLLAAGTNAGLATAAETIRSRAMKASREEESHAAQVLRSVAGQIVHLKKKRDGKS